MVSSGSAHRLVVDSSPLIYLAKLEALDVFTIQDPAHITPGIRCEVLVPQAAVRFPEMAAAPVISNVSASIDFTISVDMLR